MTSSRGKEAPPLWTWQTCEVCGREYPMRYMPRDGVEREDDDDPDYAGPCVYCGAYDHRACGDGNDLELPGHDWPVNAWPEDDDDEPEEDDWE